MSNIRQASGRIADWRANPVQFVVDNFHVEPDEWQLDVLNHLAQPRHHDLLGPRRMRLALKACTGPGKAQPVDTIVETPEGPKRWGDVKPGDFLFALDGSPTKVIAQTWRGTLPLYRVTFDDGLSTVCCADHLWRTRGRTERRHISQRSAVGWDAKKERRAEAQGHYRTPANGWSVLSLAEIMARNDSNDGRTRRQFEVPACAPVQFPFRADLPLDPYVMGAWLGDGCRGSARCSWQDDGIDAEVQRRGHAITRSADRRSLTVHGASKGLRNAGVLTLGSHDKFIPQEYLRASVEQRKAVLAGLLDTDGTIAADNSMSFDVTSERLVDGVAWLIRSLGGKVMSTRQKPGRYRGKDGKIVECRLVYRITFATPFCPFVLQRKADRWTKTKDRYLNKWIDKIELVGPGEAMCVQVAHNEACYLTNDFIVTHNSAVLSWVGWHRLSCFGGVGEHPKGAALSITRDNLKDNLWTEFAKWQSRSEFLKNAFTWTKEQIYANDHPETWFLSARSFAKDADADSIGRALSGLHSKYPFILLDETGDMPTAVGRAAEQIFTGDPEDALIAQAGNPTSVNGLLYHSCSTARNSWNIVTITADPSDPKRTPRVSTELAQEQIDTYGRDNPWVMATILGLFPPAGFNNLVSLDDVERAMARFYKPDQYLHAPLILGVDVARQGDDASVIAPRQGLVCHPPKVFRNVKSHILAGYVAAEEDTLRADGVIVDGTGGWGAGVLDAGAQMNRDYWFDCQYAGKAMSPKYANKRAENSFLFAEWIKNKGALPHIPQLIREATAITYTFQGDRLILEPKEIIKKRLGHSTDYWDAYSNTFAFPIEKRVKVLLPEWQEQIIREHDPYMNSGRTHNDQVPEYNPYN